ncbi:MAG: hypothetical protein J5594_01200 [Elusimicrobiaceae bacterium]|nr:hypothetical protein [Elusimicrobiaceae bacterium]
MKKLLIILVTVIIALPAIALNFNKENLEIDEAVKTEISATIREELNNIVQKDISQEKDTLTKYRPDDKITLAINNQIRTTRKIIENNCNMRNRFPNKKFIKEQKIQKQRYENIVKWQIPLKISDYIKDNFDFDKILWVTALCKNVNETSIEVRFLYNSSSIIVTYTYTETPSHPLITHRIFK